MTPASPHSRKSARRDPHLTEHGPSKPRPSEPILGEPIAGENGGAVFLVFLLLVFFGILTAGAVAFTIISHASPWSPSFYEHDSPTIEWINEPVGIGADQAKATLRVSDAGAGLDEVVVRISQRNKPIELVKRKSGNQKIKNQEIDLTIDAKTLALREGKAELEVLAFDRTLWSNSARVALPLPVDFGKPRIDVITPQQNAVEGGVEVVFFKVVGKSPVEYGVEKAGHIFRGYQAKYWDPSFKNYDDLYFAFFPIEMGFDEPRDRLKLTARDDIGNIASAPFNYRVKKRRFPSATTSIEPERATLIADGLNGFAAQRNLTLPPTTESLPQRLSSLIKNTAIHDFAELSDVFSKSEGKKYWSGSFGRPVTFLPSSSFGETRTYTVDGKQIHSAPLEGVRFGVSSRQTVTATNAGKVLFVGTLGFYGTIVVLDHGFGLTTSYAHLSEATVTQGQEVTIGAPLGKTGSSGFSTGEEVLYETRLHGVAVSPNEWWDSNWVEDHINKKIAFVQGTLIGNPGE